MKIQKSFQIDAPVLTALDASCLMLGYKRNFAICKLIKKFVSDTDTKSPNEILLSLPVYGNTIDRVRGSLKIDEEIYNSYDRIVAALGVPKINILNRIIQQFNELDVKNKIEILSK